jgi:hypothetical protein
MKRQKEILAAACSSLAALATFVAFAAGWIVVRLFWCNGPYSAGFVCPGAGPLDRSFNNLAALVVALGAFGEK